MERLTKKRLEFVGAGKRRPGRESLRRYGRITAAVLSLLCAAGCVLGAVWLRLDASRMRVLAQRIGEQQTAPSLYQQSGSPSMETLKGWNEWLAGYRGSIEQMHDIMEGRPEMGSAVMEAVLKAREGAVTVDEVSYSRETLSFTGEAQSAQAPSAYIVRLEKTGLFLRVEYSGFENDYTARGRYQEGPPYRFAVSCVLKETGEETAETGGKRP